ncbi:NTP transferase domain-containing protein [Ekhidna sp.]|uniref:molybdenum cofactor guanylyltransferase n=1 Tax=Ekhidna sp. TaxID=2608089 RepID=UPI003299880F
MEKELNALLLVGGKSSRMGTDKLLIQYFEKPHAEHAFEMIHRIIPNIYVSARDGQAVGFTKNIIHDAFDVAGPLNGLLSAHAAFPDKAWLALAVDMPFVNQGTISRLIKHRDKSSLATAMMSTKNKLPEPLLAIWERDGLAKLKQHFESGEIVYPSKFLLDNKVKLVTAEDEAELFNVNDEIDLEWARKKMEREDKDAFPKPKK